MMLIIQIAKFKLKSSFTKVTPLYSILYTRKFSSGEKFRKFRHLFSLAKFLSWNFLSRVNDCINNMATFTTLAKIYSTKYFCNTKVSELGEIFIKRKLSHIRYLQDMINTLSYISVL